MAQIFSAKSNKLPDRAHVKFQNTGVVMAIATEDRAHAKFQNTGVVMAIAT